MIRAETFLINQLRRKHLESGQHFVFIFSFQHLQCVLALIFFDSSHFVFLVRISQFVADVFLHSFSLFLNLSSICTDN